VALVQIEVVGPEPPQRGLDALEQVLAREAAVVRVLGHREERLGGDHQVAAGDRAQRLAEHLLGLARGIDVGGVEQVDAEVVGAVHDLAGGLAVDARSEREPRAERDFADQQATASERAVLHGAAFYRGRGARRRAGYPWVPMHGLAAATDPTWAPRALAHLDELLVDHAHCEKKAAGTALQLLFRYPQHPALQAPLSRLAREELAHFEQLLALLAARGLPCGRHRPCAYAGRLRERERAQEPGRLIDTLLCCSLIEARSCERFGLLAQATSDRTLRDFWTRLHEAEARHHGLYVELAGTLAPEAAVAGRWRELAAHEAEVLAASPFSAHLHSGSAAG
jgi:tRNA-(ms[2]io[6]A)-hydroxylase